MDKVELTMEENHRQTEEAARILSSLEMEESNYRFGRKVTRTVLRAYRMVYLAVPLGQLTDRDLLSIRGIGPKSLEKIRNTVPRPIGEERG